MPTFPPPDRRLVVPVTVRADIARVFERVHEAFGRVDVVVNNAEVSVLVKVEDITDESTRAMFEVSFSLLECSASSM